MGLCSFAQTVDRRANLRLAQSLPPSGERLGGLSCIRRGMDVHLVNQANARRIARLEF